MQYQNFNSKFCIEAIEATGTELRAQINSSQAHQGGITQEPNTLPSALGNAMVQGDISESALQIHCTEGRLQASVQIRVLLHQTNQFFDICQVNYLWLHLPIVNNWYIIYQTDCCNLYKSKRSPLVELVLKEDNNFSEEILVNWGVCRIYVAVFINLNL
ncbi:hypothetical protein PHYBLDRAFT_148480 [Phycomyces blakesleeanus NRRL 1555(-)]|uniref:Uncharacterized protein n=1 Tax=Phycomyces blakesleeanus (strain ATCC 8743b / DSM 1359 / FGSC 10004 / NBRC 33097 / NRRL 1555) TaxID=763407 RepID=A0A167LIZ0_PHYB8|nr:hypothetical protein PHYBLDRAFT_148480 [Phycomyces blakesleeanus NRRL 1555(-)]OAD70566.1 hypothetical protein PHYBLDRAFT_148480 [Phycomyces blakesleeanus NRRL 1555(-)]|eukprot:XP_018288606.1 hypothetical protein PHYBLDRAFT_148480 [Phycomyces blakesleeanus NRRL 1555(-)]